MPLRTLPSWRYRRTSCFQGFLLDFFFCLPISSHSYEYELMHDFLLVSARLSFILSVCFPLSESPRATLSYNNSHAVDGKRFPHSLKMLPWEFCLARKCLHLLSWLLYETMERHVHKERMTERGITHISPAIRTKRYPGYGWLVLA